VQRRTSWRSQPTHSEQKALIAAALLLPPTARRYVRRIVSGVSSRRLAILAISVAGRSKDAALSKPSIAIADGFAPLRLLPPERAARARARRSCSRGSGARSVTAGPFPRVNAVQGLADHRHGLRVIEPQPTGSGRGPNVGAGSQNIHDAVQRLAQRSRDNTGRPKCWNGTWHYQTAFLAGHRCPTQEVGGRSRERDKTLCLQGFAPFRALMSAHGSACQGRYLLCVTTPCGVGFSGLLRSWLPLDNPAVAIGM
jgi:hypothetical protein